MKDKLQSDMKEALKAKERVRLDTIRGLLSAMQYERMQKKVEDLSETDTVALIQRELKKRRESLDYAKKESRQDLIDRLHEEIDVIESYLPKQLSEAELKEIITKIKDGESDANLGAVMRRLKEDYAGQYDGKLASEVAKQVLS